MIVLLRMWQGFPAGRAMPDIGRGQATELVRRGIARWSEIQQETVEKCTPTPTTFQAVPQLNRSPWKKSRRG